MKEYLKYLKGDRVIWIITLIMLAFSLVSVYSFVPILVKIEGGTPFKYLFKHFTYVLIAFGAMFWIHKRDSKYFYKISKFGYYLTINILLIGAFAINRISKQIKNKMAAVEKLSFTINPQITKTGIITGQKPSFQLSKRSFFFTNNRETVNIKASFAKSED